MGNAGMATVLRWIASRLWRTIRHKHRWRFLGSDAEHGKMFKCARCGMVSCQRGGFLGYDWC